MMGLDEIWELRIFESRWPSGCWLRSSRRVEVAFEGGEEGDRSERLREGRTQCRGQELLDSLQTVGAEDEVSDLNRGAGACCQPCRNSASLCKSALTSRVVAVIVSRAGHC